MRENILVVLLLSCLLMVPGFAEDNNSSTILPNETIAGLPVDGLEMGVDVPGYPSGEQGRPDFGGCCPAPKRRFYERLSYTGDDVSWLPKGSICLTFSDNYKWIVHDFRIDRCPIPVGKGNCLPIELIRCYSDYYHIIGTSLVMAVPRPEVIDIRPTPLLCGRDQCRPF